MFRPQHCSHSCLPTSHQEWGEATASSASPLMPHSKDGASTHPSSLQVSPQTLCSRELCCWLIPLLPFIPNKITLTSVDLGQIPKEITKPLRALHLRWSGGESAGLCLLHPSKVQPFDLNSLENKKVFYVSSLPIPSRHQLLLASNRHALSNSHLHPDGHKHNMGTQPQVPELHLRWVSKCLLKSLTAHPTHMQRGSCRGRKAFTTALPTCHSTGCSDPCPGLQFGLRWPQASAEAAN